jgi:hypothetical protein
MADVTDEKLGLLYGVADIADYAELPPKVVRHLVARDRIPYFHIGRTVCSRKHLLDSWARPTTADEAGRS